MRVWTITKARWVGAGAIIMVFFLAIAALSVVSATSFTEGYNSSIAVTTGTVVSVSKDGGKIIEPTTKDSDIRAIGIVADENQSIIDVQPKESNIRVAISGDTQILVTDIGGNIEKGDYLIISPLEGIAMKDSQDDEDIASKYIAIAQEPFTSGSATAQEVEVNQSDGSKKKVIIGKIPATIMLTARAAAGSENKNFLSLLGERITGKTVSPLRVVASAAILISTLSITGWVLNGSVKGAFTSLGRNPLAKASIVTNLMRVTAVVLVIFGVGLAAAYLLLSF